MKTCKDCIYSVYLGKEHYAYNERATRPFTTECRLKPKVRHKRDGDWCGQLKEKVHVISDFGEDDGTTWKPDCLLEDLPI